MSSIDGYNADISEEQKTKLRDIFPEVFSEDKIDFDRLRATLGDSVELGEKYGLSWKGKSDVFAKIQEKTTSTLHPQPEESVDWDTTQNMFIEGDNLEALKVLHKAYYGKIKMIYIDPPYNTGNDFVYNDDFKKTRRAQALEEGAIDEEGNATRDDGLRINTGGHKHSNWLDMMYPRLFLARNLLRQDGVIFVSIDDNEVHNLRLMMNEIFGEENFVAQFIWKSRLGKGSTSKQVATVHEYILCFSRSYAQVDLKSDERISENDSQERLRQWGQGDRREDRPTMYYGIESDEFGTIYPKKPDGSDGRWRASKDKVVAMQAAGLLKFEKQDDGRVEVYKIIPRGSKTETAQSSFLDGASVKTTAHGTKILQNLIGRNIFDYAKPVELMKHLLETSTIDNDIAMDFFGGSGTLAHAVNELNAEDGGNRRWVMVQLPERTDVKSEAYKASYESIAEIARERIRRAGTKISKDFADQIAERKTPLDLGFRSYAIGDSNFKKWNELVSDPNEIMQQTLDSLNPLEDDVTNDDLLTEILLKRGISPLAEVQEHIEFVFVPSENLVISLASEMNEQLFSHILAKSPSQIILLDQAFKNDVNLKTNLILQAEKQNISVEVL